MRSRSSRVLVAACSYYRPNCDLLFFSMNCSVVSDQTTVTEGHCARIHGAMVDGQQIYKTYNPPPQCVAWIIPTLRLRSDAMTTNTFIASPTRSQIELHHLPKGLYFKTERYSTLYFCFPNSLDFFKRQLLPKQCSSDHYLAQKP